MSEQVVFAGAGRKVFRKLWVEIVSDVVVLGERYEVLRELGKGAQGRTWVAVDLKTSKQVVVKELLLEWVDSWKGVELFEREGAALRTISHPGVPAYIDSFRIEEEGKTRFVIVQEYVDGKDLRAELEGGLRLNDAGVREFLRQMAEILRYLHGLSPAVIHRDIKPSNIMQHADGRFLLVDFGAVQAVQSDQVGGSTVIGTSGYMPAEQLVGRASPASDLYALAATAVHLASGVGPLDMPMRRMRIGYRDYVDLSVELTALLDAMLEPSVSLRLSSAQEVLDWLDGKSATHRRWPHQSGRGEGAVVAASRTGASTAIEVTPVVEVSPWSGLVAMSGVYAAVVVVAAIKFTPSAMLAVLMGQGASILASVLGWSLLVVMGGLWLKVLKNNHAKSKELASRLLKK